MLKEQELEPTQENLHKVLMDIFWYTESIKSIWMELLVSAMARYRENIRIPARLAPENEKHNYELIGIKKLPWLSPFKGILFGNFMDNLISLALAQYTIKPEDLTPIERIAVGKILDEYYEQLKQEKEGTEA